MVGTRAHQSRAASGIALNKQRVEATTLDYQNKTVEILENPAMASSDIKISGTVQEVNAMRKVKEAHAVVKESRARAGLPGFVSGEVGFTGGAVGRGFWHETNIFGGFRDRAKSCEVVSLASSSILRLLYASRSPFSAAIAWSYC